ncbi:MAG: septal ring lytic transglycosylase RlpA family protein [Alphaproteobacteria bacterium]|nr:septal ring lytic transglycosylase RlpA family protein [Alphaproteobacteria bacterium]
MINRRLPSTNLASISKFAACAVVGIAAAALASCSNTPSNDRRGFAPSFTGTEASPRVWGSDGATKTRRGVYKLGNPYQVAGRTYFPRHEPGYDRTGTASWYGDDFHGRLTSNGEVFDMHQISGAHPTLPLPSLVRVTNLDNGRSIVLRVNDRGPFVHDRIIDLSRAAADRLGFLNRGTAKVRVTYVGPANLGG